MKQFRELHLYLGCLFAPMLIFFAVTGSWQLFGLHHGRKTGTYLPPHAVVFLSDIHQFQHMPPTAQASPTPLRWFMLAASVGLVATTTLGIIMAFRYGRSTVSAAVCLFGGIVIPVTILLIWR